MRTTANNQLAMEWPDGAPSSPRTAIGRAKVSAEERLLLAVLEDAVRTWRRCHTAVRGRAARLRRELEEWFASEDDAWPCSFARVCDHFGLDRGAVRESLGLGATRYAA